MRQQIAIEITEPQRKPLGRLRLTVLVNANKLAHSFIAENGPQDFSDTDDTRPIGSTRRHFLNLLGLSSRTKIMGKGSIPRRTTESRTEAFESCCKSKLSLARLRIGVSLLTFNRLYSWISCVSKRANFRHISPIF